MLQLKEMKKKRSLLAQFMAEYKAIPNEAEELFHKNEEYEKLISSIYQPKDNDFIQWMNEPYATNRNHLDQLIHKTVSGGYVRSKSEALISMFLSMNQIPFRYECELQLGGTIIHPDFTIRHPRTGEIYYWEHFGMMDENYYASNAYARIQLYISHGIIPGVNLITTYETKSCPLDSEMLVRIIEVYFK